MDSTPSRRLLCGCVLAILLFPARLPAQEGIDPEQWQRVQEIVAALRAGDAPSLAPLVDFEARHAEGFARGTLRSLWTDLDELDQVLTVRETTQRWIGDEPRFLSRAIVWGASRLDDPDEGRGPIPDRSILQIVLRELGTERRRDLLVVLTASASVVDLQFGRIHPEGGNPAGPEGLLPEPLPALDGRSVRWPADTDELDRSESTLLVDELLAADNPRAEAHVAESLHRMPRYAAAALLERLLAMDDSDPALGEAQGRLVGALQAITGRHSSFDPIPRWGEDEKAWLATNRAEIAAWQRWHEHHGSTFVAAPIRAPLDPTFAERTASARERDEKPLPAVGSDASSNPALAETGASGTEAPVPSADPETLSEAPPVVPEPVPAPPAPPAPPTPAEPALPKVRFRTPELERPAAGERAAGLEILWQERRRTVAEVASQIPPGTLATLDEWAAVIPRLELRIVLGRNPDCVLLGRARDETLASAAAHLDAAWDLLDPLIPRTRSGEPRPVVALLFDQVDGSPEFWTALLDDLVVRGLLREDEVWSMRNVPRAVLLRKGSLFLQPTWDLSGEGGFELSNEVVHKFTQCLLSERCGPLPPSLSWAFGHWIENRLFHSVHQFSASGFVPSGAYFDWPVLARQLFEKHGRRKEFSLAERLLRAAQDESLESSRMAWGILETLAARHPGQLSALLRRLSELHALADPYALSGTWRGSDEDTEALLAEALSALKVEEIVHHLKTID